MCASLIMIAAMAMPATATEATIAAGRTIALQGSAPEQAGCASCHLENGAGQPEVGIPRLAGLTSSYIHGQLDYFASGKRHNVAMAKYAAMLTSAQRQEAADYFASLPAPGRTDQPVTPQAQLTHGQSLFLNGDGGALLPCAGCHGSAGLGVGDFSPRLAGQSRVYLTEELQAWHAGAIRDPSGAFMQAEAGHLNAADIKAVAAFAATLAKQGSKKP